VGAIRFAAKLGANTCLIEEYLRSKTNFRLAMDRNTIQTEGALALADAIEKNTALKILDICIAEVKVV
jgi:hypothetical protein